MTWQKAAEGAGSPIALTGLKNGEKIHVRVIAANAQRESAPSREYPIYVTDHPPEAPDGLDLVLQKDRIDLTWGEIWGPANIDSIGDILAKLPGQKFTPERSGLFPIKKRKEPCLRSTFRAGPTTPWIRIAVRFTNTRLPPSTATEREKNPPWKIPIQQAGAIGGPPDRSESLNARQAIGYPLTWHLKPCHPSIIPTTHRII